MERIKIVGPIGKFEYRGKVVNGVTVDDVVASVESLPPGTKELTIDVATPGGSIPVGKAIYEYLTSLNSRMKITMRQIGDIASIGTYFWFASPNRVAATGINPFTGKPYQMMIHNPWTPHTDGDATALEARAASLRADETEMATFYSQQTGLPVEAVQPLMKVDSSFDGDRALVLRFATETYQPINNAALMKPEDKKSFLDGLMANLKTFLNLDPPPPAPGPDPMVGKDVVIDGAPAVDGVYTIKAGKVVTIAPLPAEGGDGGQQQAPPPPAVSFDAKKFEDAFSATLDKALAKQKEEFDAEKLALKTDFDNQIVDLKKQIKTTHTPVGYTPENRADLIAEWDRSFKANEHTAMRKENPDRYRLLYYAKYGKEPNL